MSDDITAWTDDIHEGDALETLQALPADSVHSVITSPPYFGMRNYGVEGQIGLEESIEDYLDALLEVIAEVRRVLRSDGSFWLNLADTYASSSSGWDGNEWSFEGSQMPEFPRRDDSEINARYKSRMAIPERLVARLVERGWVYRDDVAWTKPNTRPEGNAAYDRLERRWEHVYRFTPEPQYWFDLFAIREEHADLTFERLQYPHNGTKDLGSPGSVERLNADEFAHPQGKNPGDAWEIAIKGFSEAHFATFPEDLVARPLEATCPPKVCVSCGTPYERETRKKLVDSPQHGSGSITGRRDAGDEQTNYDGTERRNAIRFHDRWEQGCDCETDATAPGIVLDPFAGAGTTCLVAEDLNRRWIGVDLNPEYVALAQRRVGVPVENPEYLRDDDALGLEAFTRAEGGASE